MKRRVLARLVLWSTVALGTLACSAQGSRDRSAVSHPTPPDEPARGVSRAAELYTVGEAMYAEGRHVQAVAVWRHALLSLPEDPRYDALRHELILRMGHGLGVAFSRSGDESYLDRAEQMLERYLVVHGELFDEGPSARAERAQVYELLGDIAVARSASPVVAASAQPSPKIPHGAGVDDHAGEVLDGEVTRQIVVEGQRRPGVDDPAERARLRSSFGDAQTPGVLTVPGIFVLHPERALVRVRLWPELAHDEGRPKLRAWLAVVRGARPWLEACYSSAYARHPADLVDLTLEVTLSRDGQGREPAIVAGELVDPLGDACVLDALAAASVEDLPGVAERDGGRILIELRFFWQPPAVGDEVTGQSPSPVGGAVVDAAEYAMPKGP